jgi:uncharacterized protein YjeT (DUF2065 family)
VCVQLCSKVEEVLRMVGAQRVVAGHNVQVRPKPGVPCQMSSHPAPCCMLPPQYPLLRLVRTLSAPVRCCGYERHGRCATPACHESMHILGCSSSSLLCHRKRSSSLQEHVLTRCGGRVVLADVGMTRWIRGASVAAFRCIDGAAQILEQ